jgi:hypothetical protein
MNDHTFVIRTDKNLHEKIRKLAYLANTSRSAAIRKLLSSQEEDQQIAILIGSQVLPTVCRRSIAIGLGADGVDASALGLVDPI